MVDFKELEQGVSLGGYTLEQWIRTDGAGTFFAALTDDGERLLMKVVPAHDSEAEEQFATWQRSRLLRHANLLDVRDVGRGELSGSSCIYAVFEYPDDVLASALVHGPLSEPETRSVLEAALAALRYLHNQGLVHGAVVPEGIVAVGETVKLATYALRESDDLSGHAEDVRQLGELVRRLRAPEPLNEPLATIVRHSTAADPSQRWTLAEIAKALEPPAPVERLEPPPAVTIMPAPAMPAEAPPLRVVQPDARPSKPFPKWIFAGVAILLLSILIFNLRRKPGVVPVTPAPPAASEPVAPPPVNVTPPRNTAPAPAAPAMWRVIAFTYRSRNIAEKKVKQIDTRWPDLHAAVFTPKGRRGYYLVALGNGMNREEAARMQQKARRLGLPRDTYVQNYGE